MLEKDAALAVATQLSTLLRADGYRVVMSRTQDSTMLKLSATDSVLGALTGSAEHRDLAARAACANAAGASALLSIHFNAFGDPSVGGTESFYDAARSFSSENRRLATALQAAQGLRVESQSIFSTARKASCGISTRPTRFMRFLPSFCFSSNLRLREISPP